MRDGRLCSSSGDTPYKIVVVNCSGEGEPGAKECRSLDGV